MRKFTTNKHKKTSNALVEAEPPFSATETGDVDNACRLAITDLSTQVYGERIIPIQITSPFSLDRTTFMASIANLQIEVSPQVDGTGVHVHTAHNPSDASENLLKTLISSLTNHLPK